MLCAGEAHLLSNTTIFQNLTKPKGPHTFSGRNSLLMFSWNESTPLSPAPYWCSITWTSLEYSSKTWGLEVSPCIPARRNSMHCLYLFVWSCYQLLWRITFCWPCSLCFHNLQGYGLALNSRYGYRWQGKDSFHLNASDIRWTGQILQSLVWWLQWSAPWYAQNQLASMPVQAGRHDNTSYLCAAKQNNAWLW